jgi:hypothetical protein
MTKNQKSKIKNQKVNPCSRWVCGFYSVLIAFLLLLFHINVFGDSNALDTFKNANKFYENSNYTQAIDEYKKLVSAGLVNTEVYYNLGNAYYRNRQPGLAILNYEKALRLSPADRDVAANLAFLRKLAQEPEPGFLETVYYGFLNLLNLNGLTLFCSLVYLLFITGVIIYVYKKRQLLLIINSALFIALVFTSGWLYLKFQNEVSTRWAVITRGPVEIRNGPGTSNTVAFNLSEGRKVFILSSQNGDTQKDDWAAIGLKTEGLTGWVEKESLSEI